MIRSLAAQAAARMSAYESASIAAPMSRSHDLFPGKGAAPAGDRARPLESGRSSSDLTF